MRICGNCGTGLHSIYGWFCSDQCEQECITERAALIEAKRSAASIQRLNPHLGDGALRGWLAMVGGAHPAVRMQAIAGQIPMAALQPGEDWPELHESFNEVIEKLRETA